MALQVIMGGSGYGKSFYLCGGIVEEAVRCPEKRFVVIVPEQFTMQTQKDFVMRHPRKGILNVDVLSFQRLAYRVFEETGADNRTVLEETGKSLVLRLLAENKRDELGILGSNLEKTGYIHQMKSMISELMQYGVAPEELLGILKGLERKPRLRGKVKDLQVLYEEYLNYLRGSYITSEELLEVLCFAVPESRLLKGCVMALDGFTGFTPVQDKLIRTLMPYVERMLVSVTIDGRGGMKQYMGEHTLFHMSQKMIDKLYWGAKETKTEILEPVVIGKHKEFRFRKAQAIAFLEGNLFRYRDVKYRGEQEEIQIHSVKNPLEEARFIASSICNMVRNEGLRYRDVAVVTGDMKVYADYLEREFAACDIPVFIDYKKSIQLNPAVEFVRSAFWLVRQNYSYDSVFHFLKCGLIDLPGDDVDMLENYVLALGIRGYNGWSRKWTRHPMRQKDVDVERVDKVREEVMKRLSTFTKGVRGKDKTVRIYTEQIYQLLADNEIQLGIKEMELHFAKSGEAALQKEYAQVYGMIIDLLDKMIDLLGDVKIPLKQFMEILDAGLEELKVGVIPPGVDQVIVGDIERTRLTDIQVLFFAGVNDGIIPKNSQDGGVLTDQEREYLLLQDLELAPTKRQNMFIQKFYLYLLMTKPSRALHLSFSKNGSDGEALRPSYIIRTLERMFPEITVKDEDEKEEQVYRMVSLANSLPALSQGLRAAAQGDMPPWFAELYSIFLGNSRYSHLTRRLVDAAFYFGRHNPLQKETARMLYGLVLENSVTRLERFASCAFAHFIDYGLLLKEREEYSFEAMDMGNIFHYVLEAFSEKLEKSPYDWFYIPKEVQNEMIHEAVTETAANYGNEILDSSSRNRYLVTMMERILKRTVWALSKQVQRGTFKPGQFEISFSMADDLKAANFELSKEEKLRLRGRIDRLDTYEDGQQVYVKVIDYKSGNTSFDLAAFYYGLQLQLVVYMNAAVEIEKSKNPNREVVPAGILYYNMKDPMIDRGQNEDMEMIEKRILKELKMNGLVNSAPEILKRLDSEIEGYSDIIPVSVNKNGSLGKNSNAATTEEFQTLSRYADKKIREIGKKILAGEIQADPYEMGKKNACEYCSYKGICGFDKKIPGFDYRRLKKLNKEEAMDAIKGSKEEEN